VTPAPVRADAYWDNHWRWYDGAYRPYYTRRYYAPPTYYYPPAAPYYGGTTYYYGPTYPSYGPSYPYSTGYYGGGVQVGPLRFGWW
jgi:hypothetical protein